MKGFLPCEQKLLAIAAKNFSNTHVLIDLQCPLIVSEEDNLLSVQQLAPADCPELVVICW